MDDDEIESSFELVEEEPVEGAVEYIPGVDDDFVVDYSGDSHGEDEQDEKIDLSQFRTSDYDDRVKQARIAEGHAPKTKKSSRYEEKFPNAMKAAEEEAVERERRRKAERIKREEAQHRAETEKNQTRVADDKEHGLISVLKKKLIEATETERRELFEEAERDRKKAEKEAKRKEKSSGEKKKLNSKM